MGAQGTTTIDFGAFPGVTDTLDAPVLIADVNVLAGSLAEAWVIAKATADHSVDEHIVLPVEVYAEAVAGVGLQLRALYRGIYEAQRMYGLFNVGWVWN